ncbi:lasso RiPP family leader peptide-containing protein [Streptomyces coeruleoprunus]|uniref:Lasso RiPP family leader peptide-containing protein n=1 Tax=Streptomyces coeruleoprunus TaxID=285563 RepID=A0ABV9X8S3_9ACTN
MLRYTPPTVIRLGRVEELTGQLRRGVPDLLDHGNIA